MKISDYILISRNGALYKARMNVLSSVVCLKDNASFLSSSIDAVSSFIEDTRAVFSDSHYSKTEMKSDFCTKEEISSLTANKTYVLIPEANAALYPLVTKLSVDTWKTIQSEKCAEVYIDEMDKMRQVMEANAGDHSPAEYAIVPNVEDLIDGTHTQHDYS